MADSNPPTEVVSIRRRRKWLAPLVTVLAIGAASGAGTYAWHLRGEEEAARAQLAKLQDEKKALSDALELHRAARNDLDVKLTTCKDELNTEKTSFAEVDVRRTTVEAQLTVCQSQVTDLAQQTKASEALLGEFKALTGKFQRMIDAGKLDVVFRRGQMVVKLPDAILFPSGSAELSEGGQNAIGEVASILKQMKRRRFTVAGHTDNVPIASSPFKNNWELSSARAVKVTEMLIQKGVAPGILVAAGYGPYDPIAPNTSPTGRQRNRRIEIILEPDLREVPATLAEDKAKAK